MRGSDLGDRDVGIVGSIGQPMGDYGQDTSELTVMYGPGANTLEGRPRPATIVAYIRQERVAGCQGAD